MLQSRTAWEDREDELLAPYAVRSRESRGRKYVEGEHSRRSCYQRDRDRILHSRCFRRLEYKTQVFVNGTADHYRTRLTHTMEMAAVARTLARIFRLNEDLCEAVCLAHDIGHTPFGHRGENLLNELMRAEGGFDHNDQSLRWVELLESQYPNFPGLNLTWEVRAGLRKHRISQPGLKLDGTLLGKSLHLEGQIADCADEIGYYAHDVDDGLEAGLIAEAKLEKLQIWRDAVRSAEEEFGAGLSAEQKRRVAVRNLMSIQVEDLIKASSARFSQNGFKSVLEVTESGAKTINFSSSMREKLLELRYFLFREFYTNAFINRESSSAIEQLRKLFYCYLNSPEKMGRKAQARIESEGLTRTVCDYLSGFTDRYAFEQFDLLGLG